MDDILLATATDYATKRKAFLAAHKADYQSKECGKAYDASEAALMEFMHAIEEMIERNPDAAVAAAQAIEAVNAAAST